MVEASFRVRGSVELEDSLDPTQAPSAPSIRGAWKDLKSAEKTCRTRARQQQKDLL